MVEARRTLGLLSLALVATALSAHAGSPVAGEPGAPGLALHSAKVVTCAERDPVLDDAIVLVRDGRIEAVGRSGELAVPASYETVELGDLWLTPGIVEMHSHVGGTFDINDAVYQANPGLRAMTVVVPDNEKLRLAVAGGVTTLLNLPGSATTIGGQGVLIKTGLAQYEEMLVRQPGVLKLAQADNPKRWGWGMSRLALNWHIRHVLRRGRAYAERWEAFENGQAEEPLVDPMFEIFRDLHDGSVPVCSHTQVYQVVYSTLRIVSAELGFNVYIGHGTFDGYRATEMAESLGVPAVLGPRSVSSSNKGRAIDHDGKIVGVAGEYQARGLSTIGFNTDAPVVPQEELSLQSALGVRYGFDDSEMGALRGLTIEPARVGGIDDSVGSIEVGKHADLVVWTGHPSDPRSSVVHVWIEGRQVYDASEGRRF